jgi:hypothetical protein
MPSLLFRVAEKSGSMSGNENKNNPKLCYLSYF